MRHAPPEQPTSGKGSAIGLLICWLIGGIFIPDSWCAPGDGSFIIALIILSVLGLVFGDMLEREVREVQAK